MPGPYTVWVDDNFHYMDADERYSAGEFDTYERALTRCRTIVDEFLAANYRPGMTPEELYRCYTSFGDDPFITPSPAETPFSAWKYAEQRCQEMCASGGHS